MRLHTALVFAVAVSAGGPLVAQDSASTKPVRSPISIGDYPNVSGIRLNFRDRSLGDVHGANITIWSPYNDSKGVNVHGLALGLPATGVGSMRGIALGIVGVGANKDLTGIAIGGIGSGVGGNAHGILLGGIGAGVGGSLRGVAAGLVGVGAGGNGKGLLIGGIGAGLGGNFEGIAIGGVGVGAGGNAKGAIAGIVGAGVGGDFQGIAIGGVGVGAGGTIRGLAIGGVGVGAGKSIDGVALSLVAVGSPTIRKFAMAPFVGAKRMEGLMIAPIMSRIEPDGSMRGVSVSGFNYMRGQQKGLTIGLINYARELDGMQIGVINIARNANVKFMPIVNYHRR